MGGNRFTGSQGPRHTNAGHGFESGPAQGRRIENSILIGRSRRIAAFFSFGGWLYSWYLIRGIRGFYTDGGLSMPGWILGVIALTSTLLLASSITAGMKIPIWGLLSMLAGVALFALAVLGEFAVSRTAGLRLTVGDAFSQALENRSPILFVGVPTILILAGITGLGSLKRKDGS